jgi:hypothetical protein
MIDRISELWCRNMHSKAMWPIHGRYICSECYREYRVEWQDPIKATEPASVPAPPLTQGIRPTVSLLQ